MVEELILTLIGAGVSDFKRAEEIAEELNIREEAINRIHERIVESIQNDGFGAVIDPVAIVYELIIEKSEYPERYALYPNFLATQVIANFEEEDVGNEFDKFLLSEAGYDVSNVFCL